MTKNGKTMTCYKCKSSPCECDKTSAKADTMSNWCSVCSQAQRDPSFGYLLPYCMPCYEDRRPKSEVDKKMAEARVRIEAQLGLNDIPKSSVPDVCQAYLKRSLPNLLQKVKVNPKDGG